MLKSREDVTDEVYFGELKLLFNTDGWKILMWELEDNARALNDIQDCKDLEDLRFRQGQLSAIGRLVNFEATIARAEAEEEADARPQ
jgi:hypothetical protein